MTRKLVYFKKEIRTWIPLQMHHRENGFGFFFWLYNVLGNQMICFSKAM